MSAVEKGQPSAARWVGASVEKWVYGWAVLWVEMMVGGLVDSKVVEMADMRVAQMADPLGIDSAALTVEWLVTAMADCWVTLLVD